ncbi:MAG: UDP-3-O-acyl-N-acetylglucosamine deacetylase [Thermoanaerobaculia bacterium]
MHASGESTTRRSISFAGEADVLPAATPRRSIAISPPTLTFGFLRDLRMMSELRLGSGARLDNVTRVGEAHVVNTELRLPGEFVRCRNLDTIGSLYLLGDPS